MRSKAEREETAMWYEEKGLAQEVVLSTKVMLSRNIKGYNFTNKMTDEERSAVLGEISKIIEDINPDMKLFTGDQMSAEDKSNLIRSQIIYSRSFLANPENKAVFTTDDGSVNVIVNDKEHLVVKAMAPGLSNDVYKTAESFVTKLESGLDIAFSEKYGFLNSSIGMTGLGMRLLYTVCIPGMQKTEGLVRAFMSRVDRYGWKMYPFFENGDYDMSCVYIIGSVANLGISEKEIFMRGNSLINDLIQVESDCRTNFARKDRDQIEDRFYRSYGSLRYVRKIDAREAMALSSWLRFYSDVKDTRETPIDWTDLNTITQEVCWDEYPYKPGDLPHMKPAQRAERIRNILKGDGEA